MKGLLVLTVRTEINFSKIKKKLQDDEVDVRIPMVDHTPYYVTAKLY